MTDRELMQQALEVLEDSCCPRMSTKHSVRYDEIVTALRQALEQPARQQEQSNESAYQRGYLDGMSKRSTQTDWEAVAADQAMTIAMMKAERKPWVGLTEEEIARVVSLAGFAPEWAEANIATQIVRVCQDMLKKKNA